MPDGDPRCSQGLLLQSLANPSFDAMGTWPTTWRIISRGLTLDAPIAEAGSAVPHPDWPIAERCPLSVARPAQSEAAPGARIGRRVAARAPTRPFTAASIPSTDRWNIGKSVETVRHVLDVAHETGGSGLSQTERLK